MKKEVAMLKLRDRQWEVFDFNEIFEIKKGFYNKKPPCFDNGTIPFIGASDSNNGFTGFTTYSSIKANSKVGYGKNEPIEQKIYSGNAICVTNNGSVGYAYYQQHKFTCTHDVNPLYLKSKKLNRYIAMFLIGCIEKQRVCFTYARKWRPKRMVKSKLILPVTAEKIPDWQFMEDYMKQKEQQILKPTIERLCKRLIINDILGVSRCVPIGKHFTLLKFLPKFSVVNDLKKPTMRKVILPMYHQHPSITVLTDLLVMMAA
ncbi:restriction endonuclease subunit S [Bacteroides caecimuris]|uniref:restriction endonuclease subunit S n=1 Tax=Bacteroides caecimuris TaxID=1796613 RepID=UPI0026E0FF4F|nr:restriction endonuclease subunit S [Bacteroides caecimuris]